MNHLVLWLINYKQMSEIMQGSDKKCSSSKKVMVIYGVVRIGSSIITATSLLIIALGFSSIKNHLSLFNKCIDEQNTQSRTISQSVHFCYGGK